MGRKQSSIVKWVESNIDCSLFSRPRHYIPELDKKGYKEWDDLSDQSKYSTIYRVLKQGNSKKKQVEPVGDTIVAIEHHPVPVQKNDKIRYDLLPERLESVLGDYDEICEAISELFEQGKIDSKVLSYTMEAQRKMQEVYKVLSGEQDEIITGAYTPSKWGEK